MTEPDPRTADQNTPPPRRRVSRPTWVIVGMVAVWLVAILYRNEIRARWWAYRMASTESQVQRVGYFQRLASLGELAVPRARSLLDHHDASLRSFAVALMHPSSSDEATEGLIRGVGTNLIDYIRGNICPRIALEEMVRGTAS